MSTPSTIGAGLPDVLFLPSCPAFGHTKLDIAQRPKAHYGNEGQRRPASNAFGNPPIRISISESDGFKSSGSHEPVEA
jgi:hypothetical protein